MVVKGNFSSFHMLNKKIKVALGWHENPPIGHVVSCKKVRDEGLHTFLDMIGYCMKDNGKDRFEFVHHNVLGDDMNEGNMEYAKIGKISLKNHVSLSHGNILQRANQRARPCMKEHLGVSLHTVLFHMCESGQYYSNRTCVIPLRSADTYVRRPT